MKKVLLIAVAALLLLSSSACAVISREEVVEPEIKPDFFVAEPLAVPSLTQPEDIPAEDYDDGNAAPLQISDESQLPALSEDDPLYEPVMHMYDGLVPIFCYFAFEGKEYDLKALEPNDFWLFMAMIAANVHSDSVDQTGDINLSWERVAEYAEAFFPDYFSENGVPDWKGSYSAYADPRSQSVSLHSMAVDGYDGKMAGFWESQDHPGCYETVLEISWQIIGGAEGSGSVESRRWSLLLEPLEPEEGVEKEFAYKLLSYEMVIEE